MVGGSSPKTKDQRPMTKEQTGFLHPFFHLGVPARRRGIMSHSHTPSNAAAPSGFPLQCLAATEQLLGSFSLLANLHRCATVSTPAISVSIPHACSLKPTSVSRRATHTLDSIFSCAAIFPRTGRSATELSPLPGRTRKPAESEGLQIPVAAAGVREFPFFFKKGCPKGGVVI